jgi:FixJ family two-component response regulator
MVNLNQIVVVVDDDESICRALRRLLHSVGIETETFSSGEEFLGTLSSTASCRPGCVILDFEMPGINGLELQRRLAPKSVPVIVITAHDDPAVREKAIASGAAVFLQKPLNKTELISAIEMALGATPTRIERCTP